MEGRPGDGDESESDFETLAEREFSAGGSLGSVTAFACPYEGCSKFFSRQSRLATHVYSHTGQRPFVCPEADCGASYTRRAHLKRHHDNQHVQAAVRCSQCGLEFNSKYSCQSHVKHAHEDPLRIHCAFCGQTFAKKSLLHKHVCPSKLSHQSSQSLSEPPSPAPKRPHACSICQKTFAFPNRLRLHLKSHEPKVCDVCQAQFQNMSLLRKHKAQTHAHRMSAHPCSTCGKSFKCPASLKEHELAHKGEVFKCPASDCQREYAFFRNLRQHVFKRHPDQDLGIKFKSLKSYKMSFTCEYPGCGKVILNHRSYKHHLALHEQKQLHIYRANQARTSPATVRKDKGNSKKAIAAVLTNLTIDPDVNRELLQDRAVEIQARDIEHHINDDPDLTPIISNVNEDVVNHDVCGRVLRKKSTTKQPSFDSKGLAFLSRVAS